MRGVLLDLDGVLDPDGRWFEAAIAWGRDHLLAWWDVAGGDPSARLGVADLQRALRRTDGEPVAVLKQAARRLAEPWAPGALVAVAGAAAVLGLERSALALPSAAAVRPALTAWRAERRRVAVLTRWPAALATSALRLQEARLDDAVHAWLDPSAGHPAEAATFRAARRHPALRGVTLVFASTSPQALDAARRGGLEVWPLEAQDPGASLAPGLPPLS